MASKPRPLTFIGSSLDDLRAMPASVGHAIGFELMTLQLGGTPHDLRPMPVVRAGACEVCVGDEHGAFRAIYVARFSNTVHVLHAFQKKTQRTAKNDLALAVHRYKLTGG